MCTGGLWVHLAVFGGPVGTSRTWRRGKGGWGRANYRLLVVAGMQRTRSSQYHGSQREASRTLSISPLPCSPGPPSKRRLLRRAGLGWQALPLAMQGLWDTGKGEA